MFECGDVSKLMEISSKVGFHLCNSDSPNHQIEPETKVIQTRPFFETGIGHSDAWQNENMRINTISRIRVKVDLGSFQSNFGSS